MKAIQVNPKKEKPISKKKQSPQSLHFFFFTKQKGQQKPYLKEIRWCMGFELEARKCYLESVFNPV